MPIGLFLFLPQSFLLPRNYGIHGDSFFEETKPEKVGEPGIAQAAENILHVKGAGCIRGKRTPGRTRPHLAMPRPFSDITWTRGWPRSTRQRNLASCGRRGWTVSLWNALFDLGCCVQRGKQPLLRGIFLNYNHLQPPPPSIRFSVCRATTF